MKSKSRLPKFPELPVSGPILKSDPRVWKPALHGFPCWFKPFGELSLKPFYTPHAIAEAAHQGISLLPHVHLWLYEIKELRSREKPWHPAGRLERLVLEGCGVQLTLRFSIEDQVQCTSVSKIYAAPSVPVRESKYKGPRLSGDTKSAVVSEKRKRP